MRGGTGVVDEDANIVILAQAFLDGAEVDGICQIRAKDIDVYPRFFFARRRDASASMRFLSRATSTRSWPRWAKRSAYTAPIPDEAPVIRTVGRLRDMIHSY
jgi:hypothetical protein